MSDSQSATRPLQGTVANIALWALQVLFAIAFIIPVYRKLAGVTESVQLFDDTGSARHTIALSCSTTPSSC